MPHISWAASEQIDAFPRRVETLYADFPTELVGMWPWYMDFLPDMRQIGGRAGRAGKSWVHGQTKGRDKQELK